MKTQPQIQPEIACTMCDWTGMEADLTVPHHVLDDDMPDYGGHCPKCGEHSHDGNIVDFSEYKDMYANSLLSNEREYVPNAVETFAAKTAALGLLLFIGAMLAFSLGTPDPRVTGWMSNDAPVMEAK